MTPVRSEAAEENGWILYGYVKLSLMDKFLKTSTLQALNSSTVSSVCLTRKLLNFKVEPGAFSRDASRHTHKYTHTRNLRQTMTRGGCETRTDPVVKA